MKSRAGQRQREEKSRRGQIREEKESEERRCRCAKRIPIEMSKIVRGHSSDPHFLDRNFPPSQFPYISWGKPKRSFMILYINVADHFLER
jgi:hypothetical protein